MRGALPALKAWARSGEVAWEGTPRGRVISGEAAAEHLVEAPGVVRNVAVVLALDGVHLGLYTAVTRALLRSRVHGRSKGEGGGRGGGEGGGGRRGKCAALPSLPRGRPWTARATARGKTGRSGQARRSSAQTRPAGGVRRRRWAKGRKRRGSGGCNIQECQCRSRGERAADLRVRAPRRRSWCLRLPCTRCSSLRAPRGTPHTRLRRGTKAPRVNAALARVRRETTAGMMVRGDASKTLAVPRKSMCSWKCAKP